MMMKITLLILFSIFSLFIANDQEQFVMGSTGDDEEKWFPPHMHSEFSILKNSEELLNLNMNQNEITNISAHVGDTIEITVSIGDNLHVEDISQVKLITNFATKPSDMNNYFATNYDWNNPSLIALSVYEWNQHHNNLNNNVNNNLSYDYSGIISWHDSKSTIQERNEENHEYVVGSFLPNEEELLITYHMKFNKNMAKTQVGLKMSDITNKQSEIMLPIILEVLSNEDKPIVKESENKEGNKEGNNFVKILVDTNYDSYQNGSKIIINGKIENYDSENMKGRNIDFKIKFPNNDVFLTGSFAPNLDGTFIYQTFAVDYLWKQTGDYIFHVNFGDVKDHTIIAYENNELAKYVDPTLTESQNKVNFNQSVVVAESEVVVAESEVVVAESEVVVAESEVVVAESEVVVAESEVVVAESEVVVAESEVKSMSSKIICGDGTMENDQGVCIPKTNYEKQSEGGGCLIATATYGSEMSVEVQQLRELRDNQLLQTESGTAFMSTFNDIYYTFSPIIADYERENPYFKEAVKIAITPMLSTLAIMENAESESEVLGLGLSVIALNLGMYLGIPAIVVIGIRKKSKISIK